MISIFTYIYISFFCSLCRLLIFSEKKTFLCSYYQCVCIFRKIKNSYICFVLLSISICFSCKRRNDRMTFDFFLYILLTSGCSLFSVVLCVLVFKARQTNSSLKRRYMSVISYNCFSFHVICICVICCFVYLHCTFLFFISLVHLSLSFFFL
jgi:hypothetical protein